MSRVDLRQLARAARRAGRAPQAQSPATGAPAAPQAPLDPPRQDAPDLPRRKVSPRTIGKTYAAPDGKTFRPSMFVTLTCPGYGRVTEDGTPADPRSYDYDRAARVSRARRGAPTGSGTASSPRTPGPAWSPAAARARLTTLIISATADGGS